MKQKILIVGGSHSDIPLIEVAKRWGLYVITTGNKSTDLGHSLADETHMVDFSDKDAVLELAQKLDITFICSSSNDFSLISTAYVAEKLNLPGYDDYATTLTLHHKDLFRQFTRENNFDVPFAEGFSSIEDAKHYILKCQYPVVIKPVDLTGGKGITIAYTYLEALDALQKAFERSKAKRIVVEEFIEGTLHSFSMLLRDQKVAFSFGDNEFSYKNPFLVSTSTSPSFNLANVRKTLISQSEILATLLKLKDGLLHMQYLMNGNNIKIIEFTRRMPGDFYAKPVWLSTGVDYAEWALKASCGFNLSALAHEDQIGYYSRHCVMTDQNGQIQDLVIDPLIKENIIETFMWWQKGDEIVDFMTYKAGIILLKYDTCEEMDEKNAKLHELIRIKL